MGEVLAPAGVNAFPRRGGHQEGATPVYSPAKAIVEAHHGQIRAHSDGSGTGARFEIILPIAPRGQQSDLQQTFMKYRLDTLICLAEGDGAA